MCGRIRIRRRRAEHAGDLRLVEQRQEDTDPLDDRGAKLGIERAILQGAVQILDEFGGLQAALKRSVALTKQARRQRGRGPIHTGRNRDGDGVPEDDAEAVRLFRLAAEQGFAVAQFNLGVMYANGEGVPEDDVLAYMWFNVAAAQGYEGAQGNKDLLAERMTREQIAEAQRLSREWIEAHPPGGN